MALLDRRERQKANPLQMGTIKQIHAVRYIRTKHIITVIEYEKLDVRTDPVKHKPPGEGDEERQAENYKYRQHMRRETVRNLANMNFDSQYDKFITLTFKNNETDVQASNKRFKEFIRKMRQRFGNFKYMAVIEFQERGAVHYHMMSDLPYIPKPELAHLWGHGFVKINSIEKVDNLGAYIVKYMNKDNDDPRLQGEKGYLCSKGLERAQEVKTWQGKTVTEETAAKDLIEQIKTEIKGKEPVFSSSKETQYCGICKYTQYNLKR